MSYCSNCGNRLTANSRFCPECGRPAQGGPVNQVNPAGQEQPAVQQQPAYPPVFQQPAGPVSKKSTGKIVLLVSLPLGFLLLAGAGVYLLFGKTSAAETELLGKWEAVDVTLAEFTVPVRDIYAQGMTLELKRGRRYLLEIDGQTAAGNWQLKDGQLRLTGRELTTSGQVVDDVMILDNIFGYPFSLVRAGGHLPEQVSQADLPAGQASASLETAHDSLVGQTAALGYFTSAKKRLFAESSFQDSPCLVLTHDTVRKAKPETAVNIFS